MSDGQDVQSEALIGRAVDAFLRGMDHYIRGLGMDPTFIHHADREAARAELEQAVRVVVERP
jgi:hypothetical protein